MIYDIVNIVNLVLCFFAGVNLINVISYSRKKGYEPPIIRKKHLRATYAMLGVASFSFGLILNTLILPPPYNTITVIFSFLACLCAFLYSEYVLSIAKEKDVRIFHKSVE